MKTFLTRSKSSFILALAVVSSPIWAKPVAQVTEISGQVFTVTADGKTKTLKVDDHLEEKSEVMVEEGATVTLNDYYDATYHLLGGSHLKFFNKSVQLKRGKTWIQSQSKGQSLALTTANGHVDFVKGEFITTFDQATSRSQFLVVNGDIDVSNVLEKNMKYTVPAGSFSLIDPAIENGLPRTPTKVGLASLNTALSEFKKLPNVIKDAPARAVASVEEAPAVAPAAKKGEIIFITTNRLPASVKGGAHSYFKKKLDKKSHLTSAPIKFYGVAWSEAKPFVAPQNKAPRTPASVVPVLLNTPTKAAASMNLDHEFADSLKKQTQEQPKNSKELESLIHDLKSY